MFRQNHFFIYNSNTHMQAKHLDTVNHFTFHPYKTCWASNVCGPCNGHLKLLEEHFKLDIVLIGDKVMLKGHAAQVNKAHAVLDQLFIIAQSGSELTPKDVITYMTTISNNSSIATPLAYPTLEIKHFTLRLLNAAQERFVSNIQRYSINFALGPAGTGKTFLSVACALHELNKHKVQKIILARPAVDAGEKLGFLPGAVSEKVDPYLRPFFDALETIYDPEHVQSLIDRKRIEVAPIAFMRGRTFNDAFIVVDEAQNTSKEQMKMLLTRIGNGSRMVVCGDPDQNDLPPGMISGLCYAQKALAGLANTILAFNTFDNSDNVRCPLITQLLSAFDNYARTHKDRKR